MWAFGFVYEQCKKFYTKKNEDSSLGLVGIHLEQFPQVGVGGYSLVCEFVLVKKASRTLYTKTKQNKRRTTKNTPIGSFGTFFGDQRGGAILYWGRGATVWCEVPVRSMPIG